MKKIHIQVMILLAVSCAITANAQTATQFSNSKASLENVSFKREFKKESKPGAAADEITDSKQPVSRQTYVRPDRKMRINRYASNAFGVPALIGATFGATFSQIGNNPEEWGKTVGGFGKRFASSYATNAIRNTISFGISEAFKLDNRFERSGKKKFGTRLRHVLLGSYTTRTKTGKRIPDFPHFTGTYSAAVIAREAWYPKRFGYQDGLRSGTISLGVRFGVNLMREFIFKK